jgi:hypothetical protein
MGGHVTVIVPNIDFVYILVSLLLDCIGWCFIFNPKSGVCLSYPAFMPKPSTQRMHDPGSIVPHIRPKVLTDNQMS